MATSGIFNLIDIIVDMNIRNNRLNNYIKDKGGIPRKKTYTDIIEKSHLSGGTNIEIKNDILINGIISFTGGETGMVGLTGLSGDYWNEKVPLTLAEALDRIAHTIKEINITNGFSGPSGMGTGAGVFTTSIQNVQINVVIAPTTTEPIVASITDP